MRRPLPEQPTPRGARCQGSPRRPAYLSRKRSRHSSAAPGVTPPQFEDRIALAPVALRFQGRQPDAPNLDQPIVGVWQPVSCDIEHRAQHMQRLILDRHLAVSARIDEAAGLSDRAGADQRRPHGRAEPGDDHRVDAPLLGGRKSRLTCRDHSSRGRTGLQ